ncbi:MAG: hypothetical protein WC714_28690 [Candidatus Obscuribacterales bacterium]|jgi:hypothetical protein
MIKDIVKKLLEQKTITPSEKTELLLFFELAEQNANVRTITEVAALSGNSPILEDLTSQITGANTHFVIAQAATSIAYVSCNLIQQPTSYVLDDDMRGFTLTFTPTTRDKLTVGYFVK